MGDQIKNRCGTLDVIQFVKFHNFRYSCIMIPWKFRDLIFVFISIILLVLAFFGLQYLAQTFGFIEQLSYIRYKSFLVLILFILQNLIFLIPLYFFTFKKYGAHLRDFGFRVIPFFRALRLAFTSYFLFFFFVFVLAFILYSLGIEHIPGFEPQEPHLPLFGDDRLSTIIAIFVVVFIAPFVEEIFFRGFVLQTLLQRFSVFFGTIFSALIFTIVHFEFQSFIPIFLLALILNRLFLKTKNIWPGIAFHIVNNSIALAFEYWFKI